MKRFRVVFMQSVGISLGRPKLRGRPSLLDLLKLSGSSSSIPKFSQGSLDEASDPEVLSTLPLPLTPGPGTTNQSPILEHRSASYTNQHSFKNDDMPPVCFDYGFG